MLPFVLESLSRNPPVSISLNDSCNFFGIRAVSFGIDENGSFQWNDEFDGGVDPNKLPARIDDWAAAVSGLERDVDFESPVASEAALRG